MVLTDLVDAAVSIFTEPTILLVIAFGAVMSGAGYLIRKVRGAA